MIALNTLQPAKGSRAPKKRVGRGIGCGSGKTCRRGHKGQHSRSGGYHKVGFEGGQMPLQRRVPKFGFVTQVSLVTAEVKLHELNVVPDDVIELQSLIDCDILPGTVKFAKVILSGEIKKPVTLRGLRVTKGARAAIEKAGGTIEL